MYSLATVLGLTAGTFAAGVPGAATEYSTIEEAYTHLIGPEAQYPAGYGRGDRAAIEVVRAYPEEFERLIKAAVVKGGDRGHNGRAVSLVTLVRQERYLTFLREVIATYDLYDEDLPFPFVGSLTAFGEERDMAIAEAWISQDPDSERSRDIASVISGTSNPYAWALLSRLRDNAPGKWLEVLNVSHIEYMDNITSKIAPSPNRSEPTAASAQARAEPAPIPLGSAPDTVAPPASIAPEEGVSPWVWVLGALAVVIAGLAVAMRRRG